MAREKKPVHKVQLIFYLAVAMVKGIPFFASFAMMLCADFTRLSI